MATVTNWIDHLNKPAEEVVGAVYPGAGSSEGILVIIAIIIWIGWQKRIYAVISNECTLIYLMHKNPSKHIYFCIDMMSEKPERLKRSMLPCVEKGSNTPFKLRDLLIISSGVYP